MIVKGPPFVAVIAPPRKRLVILSKIPDEVFVLRSPVKLTLSLMKSTAVCETLRDEALMAASVRALQLFTVKAPILVPPPIAPDAVIVPVPAVIARACAPDEVASIVFAKLILPLVEVSTKFALIVMGPAKEMLVAETLPPMLTGPDPV